MASVGLPQAHSQAATSFAKSFYGMFTNFFPEGDVDGRYDADDDTMSLAPSSVAQPRPVAQPPVVHKPQVLQPPVLPHQSKTAPPETFFIDAEAQSFFCERQASVVVRNNAPASLQPTESIAISRGLAPYAAESPESESIYIAVDRRGEPAMTPYGPAPSDMGTFHRTTFAREHLQSRQQQMQAAEQRQQELHQRSRRQEQQHKPQQPQQQPAKQRQKQEAAPLTIGELLDQHVGYFLNQHPDIAASRRVLRKRPGCYEINGKDVKLDWEHNDPDGGQGYLVVIDGGRRQAFSEYVRKSNANTAPGNETVKNNNLRAAQQDTRKGSKESARERYEQSKLEALKAEQVASREQVACSTNAVNTVDVNPGLPMRQEAPQTVYIGTPAVYNSGTPAVYNSGTPAVYNSGTPAVYNSGAYNSGVYNSGNSGVYNSGVYNSGNSGVYNSGVYTSGVFNSGVFASPLVVNR